MAMTVIGVLNSAREAQQANDALVRAGIAAESIETHETERKEAKEEAKATPRAPLFWNPWMYGWLQAIVGEEKRDEAGLYSEAMRRGAYMVTVVADDTAQAQQVASILEQHGAIDVEKCAEEWRREGWTGYREDAPALSAEEIERERQRRAEGSERIPVVKEELEVSKREVERGRVRVFSQVVKRPVEAQITLHEEHAEITHHVVDRPASEAELHPAQGQTIEITERAEEPVISKKARVVEEIEVGKRFSEHEEVVRDEVQETRVEIKRDAREGAKKRA